MTVSFTSTYGFGFKQPQGHLLPKQIEIVKSIAGRYGGLVPSRGQSKPFCFKAPDGSLKKFDVCFSVRQKNDKQVKAELQKLGVLEYDVVEIHNVQNDKLLDAMGYKKEFREFDPAIIAEKKAKKSEYLSNNSVSSDDIDYDAIDVHIPETKVVMPKTKKRR